MINLSGKIALVTGVADNIGFGWHIAKMLRAAGAEIILSCHPRVQSILERYLSKERYAHSRELPFSKGQFSPKSLIPCDVGLDADITRLFEPIQSLDILIHSVAFSPEITKAHIDVSREAYLTAINISSYSLVALSRAALPAMQDKHGSIVGLSYLASERVIPFYGG